ncbi:hypothetical protein M422DRAFT_267003 [Sphaerobolus stellatus SS14]|uniref:Uncharacterized protein n=1 Tax=Sphaerobolus stellatus (strain SS14) TaxID=990650 RepID=A0A0C9U9X1_SPHS4|nr:hypothetical protein M422DRAFT_267003 [Sphaerobolus stellatus SS14]
MSFCQPISEEQLALFLEAAKLMTIPEDDVPPLMVEAIPQPYATQNETILTMYRAMVAEAIKTNTNNMKEYEERKELWYRETAIAAYLDAKKKADEEEAKRKAEEAAEKKAAEEENERTMDANSEGEDEVNKDETSKLKLKSKKTKSHPIVDSESEETEEVKAKRRNAKGKGKAVDPEYSRNMFPVDYTGCPRIPVRKICEGYLLCKIEESLLRLSYAKQCLFIHSRRRSGLHMPEAADDEELQEKLRKLCDEQDAFKTQKDKEKAERSKAGKKPKAGTKKTIQVNAKASGSNAKASGSIPKRARTFTNPDGSVERIPSVAESLHGIHKALLATVEILGDTRAVNEHQAKYLHGIELSIANLQFAMQTHVAQVHSQDEGFVDEEVELAEPEDLEEEVEEVREEVEEVHEEDNKGREVEDDETMKDPEADKL